MRAASARLELSTDALVLPFPPLHALTQDVVLVLQQLHLGLVAPRLSLPVILLQKDFNIEIQFFSEVLHECPLVLQVLCQFEVDVLHF